VGGNRLGRGQRKLTRKIWQRFQRGAGSLIDLRTRLGRQTRTLLDNRERGIRLEIPGAQTISGLLEAGAELNQGIGHGIRVSRHRRDAE